MPSMEPTDNTRTWLGREAHCTDLAFQPKKHRSDIQSGTRPVPFLERSHMAAERISDCVRGLCACGLQGDSVWKEPAF
jgi:hypothetical protein